MENDDYPGPFLTLYGHSQFKHTAHTASNYTHVHWDMKWISLWASTKSLLFCLYSKFGPNFTRLFYLFGCFLGVYRRTKAVHELHVWNSQIWLVASWSTENMGPRRGQSRTVHYGNWDQWAWTGKQSFAFNSWFCVAFYEASTKDSLTSWSVQWMDFYGAD